MKTRSYLIAIVIVVMLPLLALSTGGIFLLLNQEKEARLAAVQEKTRSIALAIDQEIADAEGALRVLSTTTYMHSEDFAPLYRLMTKTVTSEDSWAVLYDASGRMLAHTHHPYGTPFAEVEDPWVPAAIALQRTSVSDLRKGRAGKSWVVSVNIPVTAASGEKYLLTHSYQASHFTALLHSKGLPETWVVGLFGADGISIARNIREQEFVGTPVKPNLYEAAKHQASGQIQNLTRDGVWSYNSFTRTSRAGWTVAIAAPVEEINSPARTVALYAGLALCLVFGITVLAILFFARRITQSSNLTLAAAKSLELGNVPEPAPSQVAEADLLQLALRDAGLKLQEQNLARRQLESERERLLQSEQEARRQAENQNNAKDEFLAMLAHELRNPLAPIAASAEIIKIKGRSDKHLLQSSEVIVRQVDHLKTLIDDLLDVSRVTRGLVMLNKQEVDIKTIVTSAVEQARPLMESRQHDLHIHMHSAHAPVLGDETRLVQVISNLLTNAAKYTPHGGKISLEVEVQNGDVMIRVTDNGIGIEHDLLPHVFELFRQAKRTPDRSQGGLGLGLALVRSIVSLHGGRVEARSDGLGKGSTFTVIMPLITAVGSSNLLLEETAPVTPKPVRLMIVDDNLDAAYALANLLATKGHQVIVKGNAQDALDHSQTDPLPMYILDIGLPDMDGYALAKQLRRTEATSHALLVALTGYGQEHDKELARASGFDHHFVKPMNIEKLDQILMSLAGGDLVRRGQEKAT